MVTQERTHNDGTFGQLLRQYRENAGLGQARLAERAGMSVPAISNLERGVNRPRLETVTLLAEALALTADQRTELLAVARREPTTSSSSTPLAMEAPPAIRPRHNLPVPPTVLVGREHVVAALRARLLDPAMRLLTLTGPGGVGKTRLALAVGADLADHFADGVWLVDLAPLADAALLPSLVARVLALREEPHQPLVTTLVEHLRDQQLVLVLDNCEHLLGACADLASTLLRACQGVRILATSREGLGVSAEQVYRVPALSVPDPHHPGPSELVCSYEAVRLFVARAQAQRGEFTLSAHNAQAVAELCARLDGLPLAIELAAARVSSLSVEAITARLDERFRLLTGGPRDVPPRQRTLQAAMNWSWDLLDEPERALLRRLSVFSGGWTLQAAEAVAADDRGADGAAGPVMIDLLDGLATKSLVGLDESEAETRYRLLETVRAYAAERLAEAGEGATVRDRHLGWCLALAEQAAPHLLGPEQGTWLARLEREHDNLRAALAWAVEQSDGVRGLRLAGALWRFWLRRGFLSEGRAWLEAALELKSAQGVAADRAHALAAAGALAFEQGDLQRAAIALEEALALRRALGETRSLATALAHVGNVSSERGDYGRAVALYEEALALQRVFGEPASLAIVLNNLGVVTILQGDHKRAAVLFEETLALHRTLGDTQSLARSLNNRGHVASALGEAEHAGTLFREALQLGCDSRARDLITDSLEGVAWAAVAGGQPEQAALVGGAAEAQREALGVPLARAKQPLHAQMVESVRAVLGAEASARLWIAGRALSPEQAVALALAERWG